MEEILQSGPAPQKFQMRPDSRGLSRVRTRSIKDQIQRVGCIQLVSEQRAYMPQFATALHMCPSADAWLHQCSTTGSQLQKLCYTDAERKVVKGKLPDHIANIGGHRAPVSGELTRGVLGQMAEPSAAGKRRGDNIAGKPAKKAASAKEEEEVRKRQEARNRVQKRTMATFGLS